LFRLRANAIKALRSMLTQGDFSVADVRFIPVVEVAVGVIETVEKI
jgi:CRISPR/Cas system-associated protein Cas7 (RAMP superfamily)